MKWLQVTLFVTTVCVMSGCAVSGSVDVEVKLPLCPAGLSCLFGNDKPCINVSSHIDFKRSKDEQ